MERLTEKAKTDFQCNNHACKLSYCDRECEHYQRMIDKLAAYEDAEEAGLLLKLPCKFGTTIYWLNPNFERNDFEIEEMKFSIEMLCFIDWFGKYAFLTYEEAEAGLKALQEGE